RPGEYLAAGHALPRWLADRWLARHGWDEAVRLGFWFAEPAPLWLRANPPRTTRDGLRAALAAAGPHAEPGEHPQSLRLARPDPRPAGLRGRVVHGAGPFGDDGCECPGPGAGPDGPRPVRRPRRQDDAFGRTDAGPRPGRRL